MEITIYDKCIDELKIKKSSNKEKIDENSMQYLIKNFKLSQSNKIKLGILLEKIINYAIKKYTTFKDIKELIHNKEPDSLFGNDEEIIFAEFKCNLNLDTEKTKATINKCKEINSGLIEKYKKHKIKICLVNLRFLEKKDIPKKIQYKFENYKENLFGINEFLNLYKLPIFKNYNEYSIFLENLCLKVFDN